MTVSFGNASHLATVWLPELTPTTGKAASTVIALIVMGLILTAVAVMFAVFCMEKTFSWARTAATLVASLAVMALCGGGLQHITGTNVVRNSLPAATRDAALDMARTAAKPAHSWKVGARQVAASGRTVQSGWTKENLQTIATAAAQQEGLREGSTGASATLETNGMTDSYIAAHGTSFLRGDQKLRCAVKLSNVVTNNVGQPVRATISQVHCLPATATPTA